MKSHRPSGLPRRIPAWAWKRLHRPAHKPQAGPHRLPDWFWRWHAWRLGHKIPKPKPKPPTPGEKRRVEIVAYAHRLVGIHEIPTHSNSGAAVRTIQSSTGAYNAPWCVSTVQYIWKHVLGSTWADGTAGVYYLIDYAERHGATIPHPVPGCAVGYHIGQGHAGTVVDVHADGTFDAIEGNEADSVRLMHRNPSQIRCTFILRPELR